MRRAEQEREDCGHAVYRNWCPVCVERRCVEKHLQVEPWKEAEKERTKPSLSAFSCEDTFPILICRDRFFCVDKFPILDRGDEGHGQTRATKYKLKDSIPFLSPFLVDWRIILKDRNELSMKVLRESRSHLFVRETNKQDRNPEQQNVMMKRRCRSLRISAEHNTSVRITDEVSLLNRILHFAVQFLNKLRI